MTDDKNQTETLIEAQEKGILEITSVVVGTSDNSIGISTYKGAIWDGVVRKEFEARLETSKVGECDYCSEPDVIIRFHEGSWICRHCQITDLFSQEDKNEAEKPDRFEL